VSQRSIVALTILQHSDPDRIGDVARFSDLRSGAVASFSRIHPFFFAPGAEVGAPLANPFLSRSPVCLAGIGEDIKIEVPDRVDLIADGVAVCGECTLPAERIREGVVIELSGRIVLLLHRTQMPARIASRMGLVGDSDAMEQLRAEILRVAEVEVPVLIRGETGTGKELVARAIHEQGRRSQGPCVCVNMAAVPASTAASELFGHVSGAFTGAAREHVGHVERADRGSLFLDEIGEAPAELQTLLLRVLETKEVQPLGSQRTKTVDVRLLVATDADLEAAIASGKFRAPLFHRIAGYQLAVPPLRRRRDDIGRLVRHFLEKDVRMDARAIPAPALARIARHSWPGNVRQLRNVACQIAIAARSDPLRTPALVDEILGKDGSTLHVEAPPQMERNPPRDLTETELVAALRRNKWRTSRTAADLGMSRTTLYALIDRSTGIRKARDVPQEELLRCLEACNGDLEAVSCRLEVSKRGLQLRLRDERLLGRR